MSAFARLAPRLQQAIATRLGWSSLRPVQEEAGNALLAGKNAVVLAPTAGGKTEASMFPTLSLLLEQQLDGVGALYIAPIKALLNNQSERLGLYTEMVGLRRFVWHGDTPSNERKQFLREPADLLMTTPESLEVMLVSHTIDTAKLFRNVRMLIIDEVHALAGTDRGAHLMSVIERIATISTSGGHDLQRVGLSATVGNPADILTWLQGTSTRDAVIVDPPKVKQARELLVLHHIDMTSLADDAAKIARGKKSLFFCQSRSMTEAVAENMRRAGTDVFVHHSAVSKEERLYAEEKFHKGSDACIACTSTLELGIDVGDLDLVLQSEAPSTVSSFLQRMGRTGRRSGRPANTTFFCTDKDAVLQSIALIELARAGWVESVDVQDRCWPVLVHQLLALSLAGEGVSVDDAWAHLSRVPDFRGIHRPEFERLVAWMLRDESLVLFSGRLLIGPKVEKRFGRKNFMELYAVFTSPQSYTVEVDGKPLGTLSQAFVDRLVESVSCFLLSGRPWLVHLVNHDDRVVKVGPAPHGRQPTWGGALPQFLGFDLSQKILSILTAEDEPKYLGAEALEVLRERRDAFAGILEPRKGGLEFDGDEVRWWTFAGGRINGTLRHAIASMHPEWRVVPDNFVIRIPGGAKQDEVREAIARLGDIEFWEDEELWRDVAKALPNYRLSKFQPLVPPWVEREMLAGYLLDVAGAWQWAADTEGGRLGRVPEQFGGALKGDESEPTLPAESPIAVAPKRPVHWVETDAALVACCEQLQQEGIVGLDVETTLATRALCLVQLASPSATWLVDAFEISDWSSVADLLSSESTIKIIHNASFERSVFARLGISINPVVDTLTLSRNARGKVVGGHGLKAVSARELGVALDKSEQTSNWARRPLTARQRAYAAVDAEILLAVYEKLQGAILV